jgi:hypothetical protein
MVDGQGDPNISASYREAIEALYALSYSIKFALKREQGLDFKVGPLGGSGGLMTWRSSAPAARGTGAGRR